MAYRRWRTEIFSSASWVYKKIWAGSKAFHKVSRAFSYSQEYVYILSTTLNGFQLDNLRGSPKNFSTEPNMVIWYLVQLSYVSQYFKITIVIKLN